MFKKLLMISQLPIFFGVLLVILYFVASPSVFYSALGVTALVAGMFGVLYVLLRFFPLKKKPVARD